GIRTDGADAHGILAQSVGGGGGNGGMVVQLETLGKFVRGNQSIAVGGVGGDGGAAGDVVVVNDGMIVTRGARADGIRAQSIGGGGGNANVGLFLGTSVTGLAGNLINGVLGLAGGGRGGTPGAVSVTNNGDIMVFGDNAQAIFAESIAGGGGTLVLDTSGLTDLPGTLLESGSDLRSTVFGRLGSVLGSDNGGNGPVTVNSVGTQVVVGAGGSGSGVQAVGGGGGTAYYNLRFVPTTAPEAVPAEAEFTEMAIREQSSAEPREQLLSNVDLVLGAEEGSGLGAAAVDMRLAGEIMTMGRDTPGQLVQSIGGGGGRANLVLDLDAGAVPESVAVTLGATAVDDAAGNSIAVEQEGAVFTLGDISPAVLLQSVGGGGGTASIAVRAGDPLGDRAEIGLGANGGAGLDGGSIAGRYSGGLATVGTASVGLMAQSIGAGGGEVRLFDSGVRSLTIGGQEGASGNGGDIDITVDGAILTEGDRAHAVLLQSVGGGGGAVLGAVPVATNVRDGGVGDGGTIRYSQTGDIRAFGDAAVGVIAQSLGGGGGFVDGGFAGTAGGSGRGGAIALEISGAVDATGSDSTALLVQSLGSLGGADMRLDLEGDVRGGSGTGAGIRLEGGRDNLVMVTGSLSSVSRLAATGTSGNDILVNAGLLVGNVRFGAGSNQLLNLAGGTFVAAEDVELRTDRAVPALFRNDGLLLMGLSAPELPVDLRAAGGASTGSAGDPRTDLLFGAQVITVTRVAGDFVQTPTGRMVFDIAFGPYGSDQLIVEGDATVAGRLDLRLRWLEDLNPLAIAATVGGRGADLGLFVQDTIGLDYSISGTSQGIILSAAARFDQPFLTTNGKGVGRHINSALAAGDSGGIGRLMAVLGGLDFGREAEFAEIITQLSPEAYLVPLKLQYLASEEFRRRLMERGIAGIDDRNFWASATTDSFRQKRSADRYAGSASGYTLAAGGNLRVGEDWRLFGGISYRRVDRLTVEDGPRLSGEGDGLDVGIGAAWAPDEGPDIAISLSAGWQWLSATRAATFFEPGLGRSDPRSRYVQLGASIGYTIDLGEAFVRPSLDLAATSLRQGRFLESGLDGLGIAADRRTNTFWSAQPLVAAGFTFAEGQSLKAEFQARAGAVLQARDAIRMPYRLIGANAAAEPARQFLGLNGEAALLGADVALTAADRMSLTAGVTTLRGARERSTSGHLRLSIRF
ncbi:MAG: hypothetical protein ACK4TG_04835, partial [Thermaurantiacus sp.]